MNDAQKRCQLGVAIEDRRHALGLSQMDAAVAGGISAGTWRAVEKQNGRVRKSTLASINRGLHWPSGTAFSALRSGTLPSVEIDEHRRLQTHLVEARRFIDGERDTSPGPYPPDDDPPASDALRAPFELAALSGRLDELSDRDRQLIETMINQMLDED